MVSSFRNSKIHIQLLGNQEKEIYMKKEVNPA
jgi:hypothetical protein